ncbi:bifunctional tRNA (5-methylaminomethyl-2-thiouridine)(34)-methyltransferase MnmD/FAD-dependent 5-carboxymethylaminomethyl-2-thiouridine(34) oxidoreductase MnmC [Vibrio quintilis]|uniref:tRNA 5-methylaminomethyl-2-thiouridine biosynthesis bifunctional protein MnmC n=1 Tax=Vibrio quintilis TaxID=1117707 RepID=A0A1M7YTF7_9VIBR|nr:bifunctional tRNA (5-methylaminomethyl-2-thiouridine)(34)-methyltransferase MnmD/FAD-dependent 5-carboxymethylaminomethyl-2-thiouridine(34) oxidoreductase MnmC [Vibrio quintilis]SHO55879.1 tRNA 5-methylaminomethyl-2-thiouridine biosynthesis bifunctional protein MnmC [Vibrio quintilis]
MNKLQHAQLDWNESGTPVSDQFDDVYFSNHNGLEETRYVFLHQNYLPERWHDFRKQRFVIGETGFGTGLNFLVAWQYFDRFRQENPQAQLQQLHFISFEKYPLSRVDLVKSHQAWPELGEYASALQNHYPSAVPECHRIVFADGAVTLDLWFGDIQDCMPQLPVSKHGLIDAWFLDGFAPGKNPDMWNQTIFNQMAKLGREDATCATFTAAGFVRRGLNEAGFKMQKVKGFGTKREMLAGQLEHPSGWTNTPPWYAYQSVSDINDIAIIGGGIATAALAKSLTRRGIKVSVYCQDQHLAQGASGNRQGALYPLLNAVHDPLSRIFAGSFLFARQFFDQCAMDIRFDHQWCGVTQLMWDEKSQKKLAPVAGSLFPTELVTRLSPEQTSFTLGQPVSVESLHYPQGGWLCPAQFTEQLLTHLEEQGKLHLHRGIRISQIARDEAQQVWHLTSDDQVFRHQCVVIATGHQFDEFAQTKNLPLAKVKGQVSHIPTTENLSKLNNVLCYDGYMTPVNPENQSHCIGASYDRQNTDTEFDVDAQRENGEKLKKCIPDQSWPDEVDLSANHARQGVRCVSRDHLPFVGNLGDFDWIQSHYQNLQHQDETNAETVHLYPGLYAFLGLGSRGLCSSPLMAELLTSVICNDPIPLSVDLLERLHPARMWIRKLRKGKTL